MTSLVVDEPEHCVAGQPTTLVIVYTARHHQAYKSVAFELLTIAYAFFYFSRVGREVGSPTRSLNPRSVTSGPDHQPLRRCAQPQAGVSGATAYRRHHLNACSPSVSTPEIVSAASLKIILQPHTLPRSAANATTAPSIHPRFRRHPSATRSIAIEHLASSLLS
jgi:hypothetical protein